MKMSDSQRIMVVALCMLSLLLAVGCAQKGPLSGDYIDMTDCDVPTVQAVEDSRIVVLDSDGQPLQIIHVDRQLRMFDIAPETKDIWGFDGDYVLHHYKY